MKRNGFALPLAIAIMVAVSIIAVTALQVATSDFQANRATRLATQALFAADAGAERTVARWGSGPFGTLAPGDSVSTGWISLPDGSSYLSVILRVDDGMGAVPLYRVVTEGRPSRRSQARRRIITMVTGGVGGAACCGAAVKIVGDLTIRSSGRGGGRRGRGTTDPQADGRDQAPTAWSSYCPTPSPSLPGVAIDRSEHLDLQHGATVDGSPPVLEDGSLDATLTDAIGGTTYDALAADADIELGWRDRTLRGSVGPSARHGECDTSDNQNWGAPLDPVSACWDYLPVIHATGDLEIDAHGEGQGTLLVDGDLTITGAFDFYGIVVVKGELVMGGSATITGTLLVGNGPSGSGSSEIRDDAAVQYSSCATARVAGRAGGARFLAGRHWFEVP